MGGSMHQFADAQGEHLRAVEGRGPRTYTLGAYERPYGPLHRTSVHTCGFAPRSMIGQCVVGVLLRLVAERANANDSRCMGMRSWGHLRTDASYFVSLCWLPTECVCYMAAHSRVNALTLLSELFPSPSPSPLGFSPPITNPFLTPVASLPPLTRSRRSISSSHP